MGGSLHEKEEHRGRGVLSTLLDQQKSPNAKMRKKCKKLSKIEILFLARFVQSAFYKIHISGAANRHAPVQYAKYVVFVLFLFFFFFFFFCFLSSHHDTYTLLHLYRFRKKYIIIYWLILTVNHQGSYFLFFVFIQWVKHFCNNLKHSAK